MEDALKRQGAEVNRYVRAGKVVQSIPLDQEDIECLIDGLRQVIPAPSRFDRLVDLLVQIRDRGQEATRPPE